MGQRRCRGSRKEPKGRPKNYRTRSLCLNLQNSLHASKHPSIPSVNIHYLQDPMLSTSGYKEVRKITPTCRNSAVKALECFPHAVDTGVHLPEPPSSEDPLFQRLGVLGRQPSVVSSFRDALSSRELPAQVLTPPMWLIPNNWLLEEYKGPDISAQLGNTLLHPESLWHWLPVYCQVCLTAWLLPLSILSHFPQVRISKAFLNKHPFH